MSPKSSIKERFFDIAIALACAALVLGPVIFRSGWPHNHEGTSFFERTESFRRAFVSGDFLPTWSPFAHRGHGSPHLFFYHRAWGFFSGAMATVVGTDIAVRIAFLALMAVGFFGIFRFAKKRSIARNVSFAFAFLYISSAYVTTNWLIRGAAAEFSAMMLMPYVLDFLFTQFERSLSTKESLIFGASLAALYHFHALTFVCCAFAVALSFLVKLVSEPNALRIETLKTGSLAAVIAFVGIVPFVLAHFYWGSFFHFEKFAMYLPSAKYERGGHYLYDGRFSWGRHFEGISPELSLPVVLLGLFLAGAVYANRPEKRFGAVHVWLAGFTAFAIFMQLPTSSFMYEHIKFLAAIQFPWRFLSVLTPLMVMAAIVLFQSLVKVNSHLARSVVGLAVLLSFGLQFRVYPRAGYAYYTRDEINAATSNLDGPWAAEEYLAQFVEVGKTPARSKFLAATGCENVTPEIVNPRHIGRLSLNVTSAKGCTLQLNQFDIPFLVIEGNVGRTRTQEGTIEIQVPAGQHAISIRSASYTELLFHRL